MMEQFNKKVVLEPESSIFSKSINISLRCPNYVGKKIFMEKRNKFLENNKNYLIEADGMDELADGTFCEIISMKPSYTMPKRPDGTYGCDL